MATPRTPSRRARIRRLALGCTLLTAGGAGPLALQAKDATALAISVGEPEGFATLTGAHTLLVDVLLWRRAKGRGKDQSLLSIGCLHRPGSESWRCYRT
jgi:hypothetical protein